MDLEDLLLAGDLSLGDGERLGLLVDTAVVFSFQKRRSNDRPGVHKVLISIGKW